MKIVSFLTPDGRPSFGVLLPSNQIIDVGSSEGISDVSDALKLFGLDAFRASLQNRPDFALKDVKLLPVVPSPLRKVICVGLNYKAHVAEVSKGENALGPATPPEVPRVFSRLADTIVAHGDSIVRPKNSVQFDYEGELAVIIGKNGRHISVEDAMEYVLGYSIFMDGSVRDYQKHSVTAGKNFPGTGPLGPWIVTKDEIPDPTKLVLETRVNGEVLQHASISDMIYAVAELVSYVSEFTPLNPGDVIATGTPEGVAHARTPQPWLKPGDVVEVEISGIGVLRNIVVAEESLGL
jgi:2-keto-4-pentenoate hydratase/2-oxohepta-3-ene-1,7-dioic acid hydratase in catechol pathway